MELKHSLKEIVDFLSGKLLVVGSPLNPPKEECERHNELISDAICAINALDRYETLKKSGYLLRLPCKVGDVVYEVLEETVPEHYFYIQEYEVQDVSVNAVKYADDWVDWTDWFDGNAYFTREAAEAVLKMMEEEKENEDKTALD